MCPSLLGPLFTQKGVSVRSGKPVNLDTVPRAELIRTPRVHFLLVIHKRVREKKKKTKVQSSKRRGIVIDLRGGSRKKLKMQRMAAALICSLLLFFCFSSIPAQSANKFRYDIVDQVSQRTRGTRKYCDPSFQNQTAGEITQVRQLIGGSSQANRICEVIIKTWVYCVSNLNNNRKKTLFLHSVFSKLSM